MVGRGKVVLLLVGSKKIIPVGVTVEAKLSNTWSQLLNEELESKVSADLRGVFVCTSRYNPAHPEPRRRGWRAELDDKIGDFVKKYKMKLKQYRVYLCRSRNKGKHNRSRNLDPVAPPRRMRRAPTPGPSGNRRQTRQNTRDALAPFRKCRAPTPDPRGTRKRTKASTRITPSLRGRRRSGRLRSSANLSISPVTSPATSIGPSSYHGGPQASNPEEEVGKTSTGIPSVPGPHVFFPKQWAPLRRIDKAGNVKVKDPLELAGVQLGKEDDADVIDIADDDEDDGHGGEQRIVEDGGGEQRIVEDGGEEQRIVEDGGGEQRIVEDGGGEQRIVEDGGGEQRIVEDGGEEQRIVEDGGVEQRIVEDGGVEQRIVEDGGGEQRIVEDGGVEQRIVEDGGEEQRIVEDGGGEQQIVEDDGGEQVVVEDVNGGIPEEEDQLLKRHWGVMVEFFGGMSDEEEDGIGGNAEEDENGEGGEGESKEVVAELRQLGIRYEDIKSIVGRRFSGFSNAYMLRIRNEIRKTMRDKEWMDVFQRAPLAFYFIQKLLED